jgi:hypothetical protein
LQDGIQAARIRPLDDLPGQRRNRAWSTASSFTRTDAVMRLVEGASMVSIF